MLSNEQFRAAFKEHHAGGMVELMQSNQAHIRRCLRQVPRGGDGLEIGCFRGGTTGMLLEHLGHMDVIDTFQGSPEHQGIINTMMLKEEFDLHTKPFRQLITVHVGKSQDVMPTLVGSRSFDFVYVDGSHSSKDVISDAVLGFKLLKHGGVMIFDDYGYNYYEDPLQNPKPAIDFFLALFIEEMQILEVGYQISLKKL